MNNHDDYDDDDYDDDDDVNIHAAKALLIFAEAIVTAEEGESKIEVVERLAKLNGLNFNRTLSTFSTLISDLQYFSSIGSSSRWTPGFTDVFNRTHSLRIEPIDEKLKAKVRGKFSCSLCGQIEKNCQFVVHFAGSPPIERGQQMPTYLNTDFATSDPEKLSTAYSQYANCYNQASTILCEESERQWPASAYLGLVVPGETCMKHLFTAFNASNLARSTIDEAFENQRLRSTYDDDNTLELLRVKKLASKIGHIRSTASGLKRPSFQNQDADFWDELMTRFSEQQQEVDEFSRLRAGFVRMDANIKKSGFHDVEDDVFDVEEDDDDEEDDVDDDDDEEDDEEVDDDVEDDVDAHDAPRRRLRKKRNVLNDSEEEEDDEEEPFAKLPRTHNTHNTHNTRSARRHSRVEEDPISAALVNVNSKTASKLRAPDVKLIGSRRSTIKKLARITLEIMDEKNLFFASVLLNALAKITETLDTYERGADYSDYYKKHTLAELSTTLNRIHFKFLAQCRVNDARDVAEAIVVSYELLA